MNAWQRRRGSVLILVMVVIALLSLAGYTFSELMHVEHEAAVVHGRQVQAHNLAASGIEALRVFFAQDGQLQRDAGGHYDNPGQFCGALVVDDAVAHNRGRFTVVAPRIEDGEFRGVRYGLEDESARLNLNILLAADAQVPDGGRTLLLALPGMTEEIADAILDWLDEDDEPRQFGAERDEYSSLELPYAPKNGPLDTVEELLLVRGVTPWLLFGADTNRNGTIDPHEQQAAEAAGLAAYNGAMDRGWSAYLTLNSKESNLNSSGASRINANETDLEQLGTALAEVFEPEWVTFILAYRMYGPYTGNQTSPPGAQVQLDLSRGGQFPLTTVLDLIGAKVRVQQGQDSVVLASPFAETPVLMNGYLPKLLDHLSVNTARTIPGRINLNEAPRAVLAGIPGMTDEIVDNVIAQRDPETLDDQPERQNETWILAEGLVTLEQMKQLIPFVTGRGAVYRAQVVGYFDQGGPSARVEVILDTTASPAAQLFWRDLSHLGRGYPLETLGIMAP